jgi:hypothetical protein
MSDSAPSKLVWSQLVWRFSKVLGVQLERNHLGIAPESPTTLISSPGHGGIVTTPLSAIRLSQALGAFGTTSGHLGSENFVDFRASDTSEAL